MKLRASRRTLPCSIDDSAPCCACRCRKDRAAAGQWPYPGDVAYFHALGIIGSLCFLTVIGVEMYALWFLLFGTDMSDRDMYGILGEHK